MNSPSGRPDAGLPLPPTFLHKMQMHWNKISRAFTEMDRGKTGRLSRDDFVYMCHRIGAELTEKEMDHIMSKFDKDMNGTVDYNEFCAVIGGIIKPPAIASGVSLNFNPNFRPKRPEGRSKNFKGLNSVWNNIYNQAIETGNGAGKGKPLLQNILEGQYYMEKTQLRPQSAQSFFKHGTILDEGKNQPLVKSLIEGEFYKPKNMHKNYSTKVDYIAHNRKMTREYSRLVSYNRPRTATGTPTDPLHTGRPGVGYSLIPASMSKPARSRLAQTMATPRSAHELQQLWNRPLDPKFVASTLSWLARASEEEKTHFKAAIADRTQISAQRQVPAWMLQRSGRLNQHSQQHQRPQSAQPTLRVQPAADDDDAPLGFSGAEEPIPGPPPQVDYLARNKRIPRPNIPRSRPASAHSGRASLSCQPSHARRSHAESINPTIQKSTFGADRKSVV